MLESLQRTTSWGALVAGSAPSASRAACSCLRKATTTAVESMPPLHSTSTSRPSSDAWDRICAARASMMSARLRSKLGSGSTHGSSTAVLRMHALPRTP
eukprot:6273802-Prymnesium_polylepis.1